MRMTSSSAVLTAAEYVLASKIRVASESKCSSSTRFVRLMCIEYQNSPPTLVLYSAAVAAFDASTGNELWRAPSTALRPYFPTIK